MLACGGQGGSIDRVISWGTILYGAALTTIAVAATTWLIVRRPATALCGGLAAGAGALAWNAVLQSARGTGFFVDARIDLLPASWQDTVSGMAAIAATSLVLGLGPERRRPAREVASLSMLAGVVAFAVDVYLY